MPKSTIPLSEIESSQIHAIGHDPATNTLAVQFKGKNGPGHTYEYKNFPAEQFEAFQSAESIGGYFYKRIKPAVEAHPFTKMVEDESAQ